jgi:hypothetical protein
MTHTNEEDASDNINLNQFEKATNYMDSDWLDQAACQDMDLELFFNYSDQAGPTLQALRTCQSCPVRWECLQTVAEFESNLVTNPGKGMYAGLIPRRRLDLYNNHKPTDWQTASLTMLNKIVEERTLSAQREGELDRMLRARAENLLLQPNKRTQYCKSHAYPIVNLRSENRGPQGKVNVYLCYSQETPHYLYRVNNQLLNREEYETLCAAK